MGNTTSGISFNAVDAAITSIDFNTNNNTTFTRLATGFATQLQHNSTTGDLTLFYSGVSNTAGTKPSYSTALQIEGGAGYAVFNRFTGFGGPAHPDSGRVSLENFLKNNKHLPGIPSAAEVEKDGLQVGDMQKRMMEKNRGTYAVHYSAAKRN